jgi:hypothetical protein
MAKWMGGHDYRNTWSRRSPPVSGTPGLGAADIRGWPTQESAVVNRKFLVLQKIKKKKKG